MSPLFGGKREKKKTAAGCESFLAVWSQAGSERVSLSDFKYFMRQTSTLMLKLCHHHLGDSERPSRRPRNVASFSQMVSTAVLFIFFTYS